jgi:hypothetical protein
MCRHRFFQARLTCFAALPSTMTRCSSAVFTNSVSSGVQVALVNRHAAWCTAAIPDGVVSQSTA